MTKGCKGYSQDLREKVLEASRVHRLSTRELSELFGLSIATINRWKRRFRQTGSVCARPRAGGNPRVVSEEQSRTLQALVERHPDWTENEYTKFLQEKHGWTASRSSVGRAIRRLGYSVKKSPSPPSKKNDPTFNGNVVTISKRWRISPPTVWYLSTKPGQT